MNLLKKKNYIVFSFIQTEKIMSFFIKKYTFLFNLLSKFLNFNIHFINRSHTPLILNLISVGIMGIVGLCLNIFILQCYNAKALGLFNFVYAFFVVLSQFSTFGLHYSTLKSAAQHVKDEKISNKILTNALFLCFFLCCFIVFVSVLIPYIFPFLFKFRFSKESFYLMIPGLIFFSFNKIFLAFTNGRFEMKRYAFLTSSRYIGMFFSLILLIVFNAPAFFLSLVLTVPEFFLFIICILFCKRAIKFNAINKKWIMLHYDFSCKSFLAGASSELNSRIDVLILSYFTNESAVGLYSLSLFLIEGVLQIVALFRNMVNPYITKYYFEKEIDHLKSEIQKKSMQTIIFLVIIFSILSPAFYLYIKTSKSIDSLSDSFYVYLILMFGVLASAYYLPFQFFPNQIGKPLDQSALNLRILIGNIVLNLWFIYFFGLYGAAVATALSFILSMYLIRRYITNCLTSYYS